MQTLTLTRPMTDSHRTANRGVRLASAWPRLPRLAVGIAEFGFLAVLLTVWWSLPHTPHQFAPVMPLGLPDLPASFDALVLAAQVLADAPQPAVVPPVNQLPSIPAAPSIETVLVNLGGWAAILWGLANKIINRLDQRIMQIEQQLEKLATMPASIDGRILAIERQLKKLAIMPRIARAWQNHLRRERKSAKGQPQAGKDDSEPAT